jgi:sialic acid synthase SpsE
MIPDTTHLTIGGRAVGRWHPPFVIAEIGLNHGGSLDRAVALVDAAADAGASAIKLQTIDAACLVAEDAPPPAHVAATSMVEFFRTFELDEPAHRTILSRARSRGLAVLATPFSERAVTMLGGLGVDAFKIASGDVTHARLIRACGASGKPVVISTGMSDLDEAGRARQWALDANAAGVPMLHCVSSYPVEAGHENLRAIATLAATFPGPVGLSDHAADAFAWPVAIALGASIYERHLVLDRNDGSIDAAVSSTPSELASAIEHGLRAWNALGSGDKTCGISEQPNRVPSRRALCAVRTLPAGHVVTPRDLVALRPAVGLGAEYEDALVGRVLARTVARGTAFKPEDVAELMEAGRVA